ncbi:MAG: MtrB/PioB family outer membrane beta-barrel protein, partial [Vicinamibacterales bacterium]
MARIVRQHDNVRRQRTNRRREERRILRLVLIGCAALAQVTSPTATADSATGVDTVLGNALNPGKPAGPLALDPDALIASRSPSGRLYGIPYALPEVHKTEGGWSYSGWLELGGLFGDAKENAALFRQYRDIDNGLYGNNFGLRMEKPDVARFFEGTGGGVGRNDQFYGLQFGRYNDWKVKIFYNETPHVFTTTYRSLWDGVGSDNLTLASTTPQLVAGGGNASPAAASQNVATALATIPNSELGLVRKKGGVNFGLTLSETWKVYASYTQEKREGARPFGAVWGGGT